MTHQEITKHVRRRLAASGIKARCSMSDACGTPVVQISTPKADARFTDAESLEIKLIAKVNGLTEARRSEIDLNTVCAWGGRFEFHG